MTGRDDQGAVQGGHLRRLLLDAGVGPDGGKWSLRELADKDGAPGFSTWQRMVAPPAPPGKRGPKQYEDRVLRAVADTLRALGAEITYAQVKHAAGIDSGYFGSEAVTSSDEPFDVAFSLVQHDLSPAERIKFLKDLVDLVASDSGAQTPHPRNDAHDQEDGVLDDRQDPDL